MKKIIAHFKCDNCGKTKEVIQNGNEDDSYGWFNLRDFDLVTPTKKVNLDNGDFCSINCLFSKLRDIIVVNDNQEDSRKIHNYLDDDRDEKEDVLFEEVEEPKAPEPKQPSKSGRFF